jgi:23S rRNA (uracil1939-C5)-methyltransferase
VREGWTARAQPVERAVAELGGQRFDLVVLDPPRTGAAEIIEAVARMAPRLIYVSCDPMTLGRDLEKIGARGWAQPVDMMPHTSHVETVAYMQSTREK